MMHGTQLRFTNAQAITKSDTAANHFTAFMVNVAGDVAIRPANAAADVTLTVLAGVIYPIEIVFMRSAATTATGLTGLS